MTNYYPPMKRISIIVIVFLIAYSCTEKSTPVPGVEIPMGELEMTQSFAIDVPEPSGLSFGPDKNTLLTVSDETNQIYELDLLGNVIRVLDYTGSDLEGVTYNPDENLIAVVDERDREVALIDYTSGVTTGVHKIVIPFGSDNSGLEGISYNSNNKYYYILNEINPKLLIIWNPSSGIISEEDLNFAADYSGVFVDTDHSLLWIVSDESKRLFKCDYNASVMLGLNLYDLKYEGVAVDDDQIYLINDASSRLNIYKIINHK